MTFIKDRIQTTPNSKAVEIAQLLLDKIVAAGLKPGSSFGTEASLLEQFDVSRPTMRESLRILESQGVLDLRPGPGGGIIVRKPSPEMLRHVFSVFLCLNEVPFIDVSRSREVIESALASEAATNGTEEDFAELDASVARLETIVDQAAFVEEGRLFHAIVARASGNKVLETFWSTINILGHGKHEGGNLTRPMRKHVIDAHKAIVAACRRRDAEAARELMYAHVVETEKQVRKRYQHRLQEPVGVVARSRRP